MEINEHKISMRRNYCILFLVFQFIGLYTRAQNFSIGKYDSLYSNIMGEPRRVLVHVPEGARYAEMRYPVMYLLDGESHFTKTMGILDHLSRTAGNEICPQMIVVAILHPNRERDLIPPGPRATMAKDLFPAFLEKELMPFINQKYPTAPYKVFVGHSLGGLRVINTLVYQPQLFNAYIALDPSLGMVKNWIENANDAFNHNRYSNAYAYIAMGLTMPRGMDTSLIFTDTSGNARHMRSIMRFARNVDEHPETGLSFKWKYYPDESHQSVVFKGTYDGLESDFSWYENQKLYDIFKPEVNAEASVKIITDYYAFLSQKMGYAQLPPEQGTAELIDYLIFKRWYPKALAFAQLNVQNYPGSAACANQLQRVKWSMKKDLADLFPQKSVKEIDKMARKDYLKKDPEYNLSEDALNTFGYRLLQQNKNEEAEVIFRLNVAFYPNSYNVYDSLGECLLKLGKEKEGKEAYRKSLDLNPNNSNAREILGK